jgi:hypothetical protein
VDLAEGHPDGVIGPGEVAEEAVTDRDSFLAGGRSNTEPQ